MADAQSGTVSQFKNQENTSYTKFLTFTVGEEDYGIDIQYVTEIIGVQPITRLPQSPEFVKGVINLRGLVIPVIDVRMRFQLEQREYDDRTCIIVVEVHERQVGLVVDSVKEVTDIAHNQIEPPPPLHGDSQEDFIQGLGKLDKEVKILLDVSKLIFEKDLAGVQNASPETQPI
mgnify:CR=1 FL=1